jgi:hypothetical protein
LIVAFSATLSALGGCTSSHVEADLSHVLIVAGPKCNIARIAEVPLLNWGDAFVATAQINEQPAQLILDTGAPTVVLNPEAVAALKLEPDHVPRELTSGGLGGTATFHMSRVG